jgi:hypothetical protein
VAKYIDTSLGLADNKDKWDSQGVQPDDIPEEYAIR